MQQQGCQRFSDFDYFDISDFRRFYVCSHLLRFQPRRGQTLGFLQSSQLPHRRLFRWNHVGRPAVRRCNQCCHIISISVACSVFFNEALTGMLGTTCPNLVIAQGYSDPTILPPIMLLKIGVPMIFRLTIKPDHSITVISASDISTKTQAAQKATTTVTTVMSPTRLDPKSLMAKRNRQVHTQ